MKEYTLKGILTIRYHLRVLTGLHIGGAKESYEIGGLDNPVIKLPFEIEKGITLYGKKYEKGIPKDAPYIPGSSLKGKVRSLLEWDLGRVAYMVKRAEEEGKSKNSEDFLKEAGKPCDCGECAVCKTFGVSDINRLKEILTTKGFDHLPGPPRVRFDDAYLTPDSLDKLQDALGEGLFTELKFENSLNRITNEANPRNFERVPAGSAFIGEIGFKVFEEEDITELLPTLVKGLKLVEEDYLGGSGSRGYGRLRFEEIELITPKGMTKKYSSLEELLNDLSPKGKNSLLDLLKGELFKKQDSQKGEEK